MKTQYGNWIKWTPPKPLNNVKTECNSAVKRKKALKTEKAQVQLKRQVKALTLKNKELQARLQLQEQVLVIKKEEHSKEARLEAELKEVKEMYEETNDQLREERTQRWRLARQVQADTQIHQGTIVEKQALQEDLGKAQGELAELRRRLATAQMAAASQKTQHQNVHELSNSDARQTSAVSKGSAVASSLVTSTQQLMREMAKLQANFDRKFGS